MSNTGKARHQRANGDTARARTRRTTVADANTMPADEVFAFLAEHPDLDALFEAFPALTPDDLRACFAQAQALTQEARTVRRRKGVTQTAVTRTHGLPKPDGSMHKGLIFRALLALLAPGRMLDLGAGRGNYALIAASLDWQVTAVDARTVRWPNPDQAPHPEIADRIRSVRWVQADVRDFAIAEDAYDLICILGLLHHLEIADQIDLVRRCATTPLLIDTRIAPAIVDREGPYEGILVREHGDDREARDAVPTAAWGNAVSFRHTEESLLRLVRDCGYAQVFQMRPPHRRDYTFYLCLPYRKPAPGEEDGEE
jgi:SAM-dependent methyltransferase